ncbi:hypothetical protein MAC_09727 [Metarhizium acridum CQMa 102]|uniref:Uncharacterized protein n=1 Tax=Metarhizium acridum (strain CQMa 102) TaxID=655827 RepID=E9EIM9_METAQ|nr:uncharacterized protein MAC_09727 [Metarhizium acridum CQMa 102]EFY84233.1 hypothetical protein MAC_09727 [Metarhizium acridum CQMa 102]
MASSISTSNPVKFFEEHGYFYDEDPTIGNLVTQLETRGIAESREGLHAAIPILLANSNVRPILEPYLSRPDVRLCITLGDDPDHPFVFSLDAGQKDFIILHMWSPGSEAELYHGSHLNPPGLPRLKAARASNGLLEPASAVLKKRNYSPVAIEMKHGGV